MVVILQTPDHPRSTEMKNREEFWDLQENPVG